MTLHEKEAAPAASLYPYSIHSIPPPEDPYPCPAHRCSDHIAEHIDPRKARSDEHTEEGYIPQSEDINDMYVLQKLNDKGEYQYSAGDPVMVVPSAEYRLHEAVYHPYYYNVAAEGTDYPVVHEERYQHLHAEEYQEYDDIRQTAFHSSASFIRSGNTLRLRRSMPFIEASAIP